jgi:hypothetical protein
MARPDLRIAALRRFATAITVLTLLGHTVLGFEQSYAQVLAALATGYSLELLLEWVSARGDGRPVRFGGGWTRTLDFLLPAHITALAVAMLLYANQTLWPIAFAVALAVGSKLVFRVPAGRGTRHFLNPSNTGIAVTLLVFPWVGIAPPYQFTENIAGALDWAFPALLLVVGSFLNARFTRRMPLILAWLAGFLAQAMLRAWWFGTPLAAGLVPMTGLAFLLFTFYMVTDPGTTPHRPAAQVAFGAAVAAAYGVLMALHVVFGLFFALFAVCALRGLGLYLAALRAPALAPLPAVAVGERGEA